MSKNPIRLVTELPGPRSSELAERFKSSVTRGVSVTAPIYAAKAHGALVEDIDGNTLVDFTSGIGVLNVGHTAEPVVEAVTEQVKRFMHLSVNVFGYESYVKVAERLNKVTPGDFPKKTLLVNVGAEAVENAIKIARSYTGRQAVVCFDHAFHGRTLMAMTVTAKVGPYKANFGPFAPEVYRAPSPYCYRWPTGADPEQVSSECFEQFVNMVHGQIGEKKVACVLIEPLQGEGGFIPVPAPFLQKLRAFCTEHGIVMIVDEIQSGFGRTGTMFACEQLGVVPDLITMAKGLGGGMPLSAVTGRADIMDAVNVGGVGGTYSGHPASCAAANAVLDIFEKTDILGQARALNAQLTSRFAKWKEKFPIIGDYRGMGAMMGIEFVTDRASKKPYPEAIPKIVSYAWHHGVVVISAGTFGNVLRFLIPLVAKPEEVDAGLDVIEQAIASL